MVHSTPPITMGDATAAQVPPATLKPGDRLEIFALADTRGRETRAGVAFINMDGSLNAYLDVLPVTGRLHTRQPPPPSSTGTAGEGQ